MFILAELLLLSWLVYIIVQTKGAWRKILLSVLILCVGLSKILCLLSFIYTDILNIGVIIMCLQLIAVCLYHLFSNRWWQLLLGLFVFVSFSIFMYYHGSVVGEMTFRISDIGGMAVTGSYTFYRWATYTSDVIYPFALVFNLLISPFWLRNKKVH